MEPNPDPDHVLFTNLRAAFPHIGRAEIREAIRLHGHNQDALWEHITGLGDFIEVRKSISGEERPLRKRAILRVDLTGENLDRFIICSREDVKVNEQCFPTMEMACAKCKNTWSSVGFPAEFGAHRNHHRWSLFGELLMFRQQCKKCNSPEWPRCDQTVIDRILHTVWTRVQARGTSGPRRELDEKKTHLTALCEGCDVKVCRFTPKADDGAPPRSQGRRGR